MPEWELRKLAEYIRTGKIGIPELQREFVWKEQQILDLADSIYRGYPIGLIILYELPEDFKSEHNMEYWVIDGQQRLLSLSLMFYEKVLLSRGRCRELSIWFNPVSERFTWSKPPRRPLSGGPWIKLSGILQMDERELAEFVTRRPPKEQPKLNLLWLQFRRKIPVHIIPSDKDLDELGDIFTRINFEGTRVKGGDVYSTMIAVIAPGLVIELRDFADNLKTKWGTGREWDLDYGTIIRTFTAFLTEGKVKIASRVLEQAKRIKQKLQERKGELREIVQRVKESIENAIHILMDPDLFGIVSSKYLPSQYIITTMAYYYDRRRPLSEREKRGIAFWAMLALIFRRYSRGAEGRLNRDLSIIEQGGDYKDLIKEIEIGQGIGDCRETLKTYVEYGIWDKLFLYTILKARKAKDLRVDGSELLITDITIHHIFPISTLRGIEEVTDDDIEDIGNITLTTFSTNRDIRDREPAEYLRGVPNEILRMHAIPTDPQLWEVRNYKAFLSERKALLKRAIDQIWSEFVA